MVAGNRPPQPQQAARPVWPDSEIIGMTPLSFTVQENGVISDTAVIFIIDPGYLGYI
jgi:hypothetical protein